MYNVGGHELRSIQFLPDNPLPLHWLGWDWLCWHRLCQWGFGRFWLIIVSPCCRSFIGFCYCLKMGHAVQHCYRSKNCDCVILVYRHYSDCKSDLHPQCYFSISKTGQSRASYTLSIWRYITLHKSECWLLRSGVKRLLLLNLLQCLKIPFVEWNPNAFRLDKNQKYNILKHLKS